MNDNDFTHHMQRRQAMQIAASLPESKEAALRVLDLAREAIQWAHQPAASANVATLPAAS